MLLGMIQVRGTSRAHRRGQRRWMVAFHLSRWEDNGKSSQRWVKGYGPAVTGRREEDLGSCTAGFVQVDLGGEDAVA